MARRVLLQTSSIQGVFRVDFCPVVTNVVNPSAFSVKMLVFGLRLTTFVTEVLARRFELRWFDDVCNVGCPLVARPGLAAAHGCRSQAQVLWLANGSARQTARSSETAIAFACACMRGIETAITFAGEKRAILVQFPGAKVSLVSMVAVRGRAVVPAVSCWPASVAAEASLVSKLARGRVLCAKKFALLGLVWVRARKSSPGARKMAQNRRFVACWASFFAEMPLEGVCWASFFAIQQSCDPVGRTLSRRSPGSRPLYWQC